MRIINSMRLENGDIGFELNVDPTYEDIDQFEKWANHHHISEFVYLTEHNFTRPYLVDGIDIWLISINSSAPEHVETLCRLRWL